MNENDFQDLLNEIDSMSIEEYNNFHKEALKMKNSKFSIKVSDKEYIASDEQDLNFINKVD